MISERESVGRESKIALAKGVSDLLRSIGHGILVLCIVVAGVIAFNGDEIADWFINRF